MTIGRASATAPTREQAVVKDEVKTTTAMTTWATGSPVTIGIRESLAPNERDVTENNEIL